MGCYSHWVNVVSRDEIRRIMLELIMTDEESRPWVNKVRELIEAINELRSGYPQYLRPRSLRSLYCIRYVPEAIEEARRSGIWVLTWREELTPFIAFTTEVSSLCHA